MSEINLAPHHKQGLIVSSPILLAGGSIGYGEALHSGVQPQKLGAVVVGPVMRHSHAGAPSPRLAQINSGFVLNNGLQNRGVSSMLKRFSRIWSKLECPVVVQVADSHVDSLRRVCRKITDAYLDGAAISGIELLLPQSADGNQIYALVEAAVYESELPIWAKLTFENIQERASAAVDGGVNALVVGQQPLGMAISTAQHNEQEVDNSKLVKDSLFGPLTYGLMMMALNEAIALNLPCAVIACGGIHTLEQAQQALDAGADALQMDSVVWVEPGLPALIAESISLKSSI
ncbi:hypothetical protein KFU94_12210 [Chloroflexi bacterium TSY]|nr:hypothetical protein [Chloroflexi bacterium TSY]